MLAQTCTAQSNCSVGIPNDCEANCGTCWFCAANNTCQADSTVCDAMSGGDSDTNICRNAQCIQGSVNNPTGCDYSIDTAATDPQCSLCQEPRPPVSIHPLPCGDGSCEPDLGETCAVCAIDCLVPGFDPAALGVVCPRNTTGQVCDPIPPPITFTGPPWDSVASDSICEDGDVCTTNTCGPDGCLAPVAKACNGPDPADLCCPAGCQGIPAGFTNCRDAAAAGAIVLDVCDPDCKSENYCPWCGNNFVDVPEGEECDGTATDGQCPPARCVACQCITIEECLEGSGFNNDGGPLDCFGWSGCSLTPPATPTKSLVTLAALGLFALSMSFTLRKRAE